MNAPLRSNICTFLAFDFNIRRMQRPEALCHITDANLDLLTPKILMVTNFYLNNVYGFWDHKAMSTWREATNVWYLQGLEQWWPGHYPVQTMLHNPPIQWGYDHVCASLSHKCVSVTRDTWHYPGLIIMVSACNNANVIQWPLSRCNQRLLGYDNLSW